MEFLTIKKTEVETNIILLRDIINLFASRIKFNKPWIKSDEKYVNMWIKYAKECCNETNNLNNKIIIIYNKWLIDKNYRDEICRKLGVKNLDIINYVGRNSSFIGQNLEEIKENYIERYKIIDFPKETKQLLNNEEVIRLMKKIFPEIDITGFLN